MSQPPASVDHLPALPPLIADYGRTIGTFSWDEARRDLAGGAEGINMAYEAIGRHADGPLANIVALQCGGESEALTYGELRRASDRFATMLRRLGCSGGDRVATVLPRMPELYVAALGTIASGAVFCPVSPDLSAEQIRDRLALAEPRVLVSTLDGYERSVLPVREDLPFVEHVLVVGAGSATDGIVDLAAELAASDAPFQTVHTRPEDASFVDFADPARGVVHVHDAMVGLLVTATFALDLRPGDVYWCSADPGRLAGTGTGILGPLARGVTVVADAGELEPRRCYEVLQQHGVSVWYTTPATIHALMSCGAELAERFELSALRHVATVGGALDRAAVAWGEDAFGLPIHETWAQPETGAVMIGNYPGMPIRPGSIGRPMPGVFATILERGADGLVLVDDEEVRELGSDEVGELALRAGWPSMFRGYLRDGPRFRSRFAGGWYLSGILARRDRDGYFWLAG